MRTALIALGLTALSTAASAASRPVVVFLERNGELVDHDGEQVEIPRFGGGDRAWSRIVACVTKEFSPFNVDVVATRPRRGDFITAVVGGHASQLGLDDDTTNGVGPYAPGEVLRTAVVHVFSRVGTGERDVANLCAVTVHEVSHSLGLDHTFKCGDVMSYFLDRCGPRRLLDLDMPCGESGPRTCSNGDETQNSFRQLVAAVGLRKPEPEQSIDDDSWSDAEPDLATDDEDEEAVTDDDADLPHPADDDAQGEQAQHSCGDHDRGRF